MRLILLKNPCSVGTWSAQYIADKINTFHPTAKRPFVLGLPTGETPLPTYKALIALYQANKVSCKHVVTFNMDEYVGLSKNHPQSYCTFMYQHFFNHINIQKKNIHLLNGNALDVDIECQRYEDLIKSYGQINLFVGGVGNDGHIAFNEPGSSLNSRTRITSLTEETRVANSRFFDKDVNQVPKYALTVGIATLMDAQELMILATGSNKANAVQNAVEGAVNHLWTVSCIQMHQKALLICDEPAILELKVRTLKYFRQLELDSLEIFSP
ncbi:Glucosamine-6-phosphate deaminase [Candidatus Hartigia pinicola]|nr:Glucosamine-6-phosphate deaminase [Candidatus Hartigia pinicola]